MRRLNRASALVVLVVATGLAGSCSSSPGSSSDTVLATYATGEVTRGELEARLQQPPAGGGPTRRARGWQEALIAGIAMEELAAASAPEDPDLTARIEEGRLAVLEEAMRRELGWDRLVVGPDEVRQYYDENRERFVEPEKIRLQHIFLRAEADLLTAEQREAVRERLEALRDRVLQGEDFAALARRHSESADAAGGGWIVLKRGSRAVRSFTEVVWELEENEVSEPIDTPSGFHIARLATWSAPLERPFAEVRARAAEEAVEIALRRREREFLETSSQRHGLVRSYEELAMRTLEDDSVLFSIRGETFTIADLLERLPATYLPHFYAGHVSQITRFLDQQALSRVLVSEAVSMGLEAREEVRTSLARSTQSQRARFVIERQLRQRAESTPDKELEEFYRLQKSRYVSPRLRSFSLIRLPRGQNGSLWPALRKGEQLLEELRGGADFAEIARRESRHPSASAGGRLIDQTDGDLRAHVQAWAPGRLILDSLEPGEVSQPFVGEIYDPQTARFEPAGVYIIRLDDERPQRPAPFEEVREQVVTNYLRRHYSRFREGLKREMLVDAGFQIRNVDLDEIVGS